MFPGSLSIYEEIQGNAILGRGRGPAKDVECMVNGNIYIFFHCIESNYLESYKNDIHLYMWYGRYWYITYCTSRMILLVYISRIKLLFSNYFNVCKYLISH